MSTKCTKRKLNKKEIAFLKWLKTLPNKGFFEDVELLIRKVKKDD